MSAEATTPTPEKRNWRQIALRTALWAGKVLVREGLKELFDTQVPAPPPGYRHNYDETFGAPRPETKSQRPQAAEAQQAAEFKARFDKAINEDLLPGEHSSDPTIRRRRRGELLNPDGSRVDLVIYDDKKTPGLAASIVEHVDVAGQRATRVTEYANFPDGVRVQVTDALHNPDGTLKPAVLLTEPQAPGVFGVPAAPDHIAHLEQLAYNPALTWSQPDFMPNPTRPA